jgi:uncharacterized repeat protein (TIGR01451 family)
MRFRYRPAPGRLVPFFTRQIRAACTHRGRGIRSAVMATALAGTALAAAALGTVTSAGPALAAPAGDEYPATWAVAGNVATGTTPSGVTVTATVTAPATLHRPGVLVFTGGTPAYFPAITTQALHVSVAGCTTACGAITYTFSRPVLTPMLDIGDIGTGAIDAGVFTDFHDTPVTLTSGTFTLDSTGSETANTSIQNGGATVGLTDPAAGVGGSGVDASSCGTFGCGAYDITTATPEITSLTMDLGYAGTGTSSDVFSLLLGITPVAPALTMTQTVSPATAYTAGTPVTFRYLVTNTGNVSLAGVHPTVTAFSGTGTASAISCPAAALAAGRHETCTQEYHLTAADVTAGHITNTATATGTPDGLEAVATAPSSVMVAIPAHPAVSVKQTASPGTAAKAGTTIHYTFRVSNTGNRPLTGVRVSDALPGLSAVSCPSATLAVGQAETCTATYTVTPADVKAGRVVSTATATGTGPTGPAVVSPPSAAMVTIPSGGALTLKQYAAPVTFMGAGTPIRYSYLVTNTGRVPLSGITVNDPLPGLSAVSCPATALLPHHYMTCTASYVTTRADVRLRMVDSIATVSGLPPSGPLVVSDPAAALVIDSLAPNVPVTG